MVAVVFTLWQCSSEDFMAEHNNTERENAFFRFNEENQFPEQSKINVALKDYNQKHDFLSAINDKTGLPVWIKTGNFKNKNPKSNLSNNRILQTDSARDTQLYAIPLIEDDHLTSILYAEMTGNEVTGVKNITNEELWHIINNESIDKYRRESLLLSFLAIDKEIFKTSLFINIPVGLLGMTGKTNGRIRIMKGLETNDAGKFIMQYSCITVITNCTCPHSWGSCDQCNSGGQCVPQTSCFMTMVDDGTGTIGAPGTGGNSGGGGGGIPGPQPPIDPCTNGMGVFYRVAPGCDIGAENDIQIQTNCETLQQLNEQINVTDSIAFLKTKTTGKQEFAIEIYRKGVNFKTNLRLGTEFGTMVATGDYIKGQAHNHPAKGMSIPSIGDIIWLRECKKNIAPASANAYNIVVCYDPVNPTNTNEDIVYSIIVDDYNILNPKVTELLNRPDMQGFTDAQKYDKLNYEMGLAFADVQSSSSGMEKRFIEHYSSFGISLYKQDNTTKNWDKLSVENNTVTKIPCP